MYELTNVGITVCISTLCWNYEHNKFRALILYGKIPISNFPM